MPIPEACLLDYRPEQFIDEFPALAIPLVGFGSKEIYPNHILAAKTDFIKNKHDFNRIPNPDDLIRIGIFDLHFMNMDRNDANFNLIQNKGQRDPMKIFAIDHVQCFGGNAYKQSLRPTPVDSIGANILRTDYGYSICKYLGKNVLNRILEVYFTNFVALQRNFDEYFDELPAAWEIDENTKQRIVNFIFDDTRNESVREEMKKYFNFL